MRGAFVLFAIGCGTPQLPAPSIDGGGDILTELQALAGATATEWTPPDGFVPEPGYRYIDVEFTQPIDHDHPELGTFQQSAAVMWRDASAPLVLFNGGYDMAWARDLTEPAQIVMGNQVSLEYRFYGTSKPATIDWTKLTVKQAMADEHAILTALRPLYTGATVQTGGSKGGENSLQHLESYPGDLDAVVAYVAPVITANPDERYATILDDIGIDSCRTALRAIQREMLMRRATLQPLATETYTIAGIAHAFETSVVELEFAFWMTRGVTDCGAVPATTDTDQALYKFLVDTSGPSGYDDDTLRASGGQYIYQDQYELGYPVWEHAHLDDLMMFDYEDWSAYLPAVPPPYDPALPVALAAWLADGGLPPGGSAAEGRRGLIDAAPPSHVLFLGGQWDPWSAGYPAMATGTDAIHLTLAEGSHWSTTIFDLPTSDRATAVSALQQWVGATAALRRPPAPITAKR